MSCSKNDLSLALVVDKQANRVLWAESGGDVVDMLLSFLTLPLGTAVRVLEKQSGLGCADELYKSVEALDEGCFQTPCCQDMLLRPRSAAERLCDDLPVKVDDGDLTFYACSNDICVEEEWPSLYSPVFGPCCRCLSALNRIVMWRGTSTEGAANGVFVDRRGRFSISDDLCISPVSASTTISLLHRFGAEESHWERMNVELSCREEVLYLLQKSLTSKTPLTDMFLQKSENCQPKEQLQDPIISTDEEAATAGCAGREFKARLVKSRARNEVMYAEIGEDVADLLFSFLTIPLGSMVRLMAKKGSLVGCMDNLYQSVENLCDTKYCAKLEKHRDMLLAPKIAPHFGCSNQLLDVDEMSFETTMNSCARECCAQIPAPPDRIYGTSAQTAKQINPKLGNASTEKGGNFAKGWSGTFMVTDEMMVLRNSSLSAIRYLKGRNVCVDDIELREVGIGKKETLALLRGLLLSRTPLTHVFSKTKKEESTQKMDASM